jgi:hypothetical protein
MTNRLRGLVNRGSRSPVGEAADQDESTVTIAALDITFFIDFKPDARMAERGGHIARAIASDSHAIHAKDFRWLVHEARLAMRLAVV